MKIAIDNSNEKWAKNWVNYCQKHQIDYKIVNFYNSDVISQVEACDVVLWHYMHGVYPNPIMAKELLFALEQAGKVVFPNFNTGWHFDDKVGQKYLLEAIGAPLVPSYVFYNKTEAFKWINQTSFPKVFKLRGGAGATNVSLVSSKQDARKITKKAFGKGFPVFNKQAHLKQEIFEFKNGKDKLGLVKGLYRFFVTPKNLRGLPKDKGYVYFQDFIPNNSFDIRLIVIGDKAYGMRRKVRKGDFRASGSGDFDYSSIPNSVITIAFDVATKLKLQSVAFDFIFDTVRNEPLIVEISYCFGTTGSGQCKGYWDRKLVWHEGQIETTDWIIEEVINELTTKKNKN